MAEVVIRRGPNALDMASAKRSAAVSTSRARAKLFEDEIELACAVYRRKGLGVFTRNFPPVAGAPQRMFFTGPGPVDFTGHWCGVPVAFDCKVVSSHDPNTWKFPKDKLHQAAFLSDFKRAASAHGRLCFAFVLLRIGERCYYLDPVDRLAAHESIPIRTREKLPLVPTLDRTPLGLVPWDFLSLLKQVAG